MIGNRLKQIRTEKKLSQKAMAELLSTSSGYISEVEQGKTMPGGKFLHSLNRVLSISIDWILTGEGTPYIEKREETAIPEGQTSSNHMTEVQHMSLVKEFIDKQCALNIDRELIELEKLDPETFRRIESYIKGTVDMLKAVVKKDPKACCSERRKAQRRVMDDPEQIPDGQERRSGMDRRKAS